VASHAAEYARLVDAMGERPGSAMRYVVRVAGGAASLGDARDDDARALAAELEQARARDLRTGMTHAGPHRDDLALTLGAHDLRRFGSAGQQRSAALALRLLELATLRATTGGAPLLLLDDPFAELDERRATRVLALLGEAHVAQVVLAVPRASEIPRDFTRLARFTIADGAVTAA
ncbi:MAG: DNA replication and repair protein RecF, partial [Gemmatimonadetes bacterium]|nr:DNA replication and repair protein RecF [Gemmatimonadota bacterium]